ncbi:MAG: PH domain-containing protein [Alphaproteobacteria bacterium]
MGYAESTLVKGEELLFKGRLHWMIYAPSVGALFGIVPFIFVPDFLVYAAPFFVILSFFVFLYAHLLQATTEMAVTTRRVIHKRGIIFRRVNEMSIRKVESCLVTQNIFAQIISLGTLKIAGVGSESILMKMLHDPFSLRQYVAAESFEDEV